MNNTSPILIPRPDRPVDPLFLSVIREIHKASRAFGFPVFVVGAVARIILLENVFNLKLRRTTSDVDFAFALDNWEQFKEIRNFLISNAGFEEDKDRIHRLLLKLPGLEHKAKVDLIPFGGIAGSSNTIAWPPDMDMLMNVAGFGDALAAAYSVEVEPGITIPVASLPGLTVLKLFAWADRRMENSKDAIDFVTLLRSYHEAGNDNRIYEEPKALAALEATGFDIELGGAWLLGHDVALMISADTNEALKALLTGTKRMRLIEDMGRAMRGRVDALDYSNRLLEQFTDGFTA